ncbi:MAG: hypothetical protein ACI4K9_08215 [Candidatus Fimenecus sp.]
MLIFFFDIWPFLIAAVVIFIILGQIISSGVGGAAVAIMGFLDKYDLELMLVFALIAVVIGICLCERSVILGICNALLCAPAGIITFCTIELLIEMFAESGSDGILAPILNLFFNTFVSIFMVAIIFLLLCITCALPIHFAKKMYCNNRALAFLPTAAAYGIYALLFYILK